MVPALFTAPSKVAAQYWRDLSKAGTPGDGRIICTSSGAGLFGNSGQTFMVNFRVNDLDGALKRLRDAGVQVDERVEKTVEGRFGWFVDPDGRRVELWEPAPID